MHDSAFTYFVFLSILASNKSLEIVSGMVGTVGTVGTNCPKESDSGRCWAERRRIFIWLMLDFAFTHSLWIHSSNQSWENFSGTVGTVGTVGTNFPKESDSVMCFAEGQVLSRQKKNNSFGHARLSLHILCLSLNSCKQQKSWNCFRNGRNGRNGRNKLSQRVRLGEVLSREKKNIYLAHARLCLHSLSLNPSEQQKLGEFLRNGRYGRYGRNGRNGRNELSKRVPLGHVFCRRPGVEQTEEE